MKKITQFWQKISTTGIVALGTLTASRVFAAPGPQPVYGGQQTTITLDNIRKWIENVLNFFLYIGGLVALIFIIWGGITYMMAGGSSEKAEKAKTRLWNGVIGALIVLGAGVIINTIVYLIEKGVAY